MKQVGSIYSKSIQKASPLRQIDTNNQNQIKRPFHKKISVIEYKIQKSLNPIKSTSDYLSNSNHSSTSSSQFTPFLQSSPSCLIDQSYFDSLTKYQNKQSNGDETIKKLQCLSRIFSQLKEFKRISQDKSVTSYLSMVEDKLLQIQRDILKDQDGHTQ